MASTFVEPKGSLIERLAVGATICDNHGLDVPGGTRKGGAMQKAHFLRAAALAAVAALPACNSEPEVVVVNRYDPQAEALKKAGPIEAPPMIQASRTYRCRDNSLVYIDFYTNNTAMVRTERGTPPVATLTAAGGNPPYTAPGYSVSANADEISYTSPGGTQTCHT
jgi:hypothetical protein